jgi:hypothetical protein
MYVLYLWESLVTFGDKLPIFIHMHLRRRRFYWRCRFLCCHLVIVIVCRHTTPSRHYRGQLGCRFMALVVDFEHSGVFLGWLLGHGSFGGAWWVYLRHACF